jgi:hypothetical protein
VSGQVRHFFDDVLICASRGVPQYLIDRLVPWDLPQLEDYRAELLSGFQTERYAVDLREGFEKARAVMDAAIRVLCTQDIGGNHQRLHSVRTQHVGITFKHILLPVWLAAYRYRDQTYRILVNGRTGRVVGTRPYSWVKITLLVLAIAAVVAAVLFLFASRAHGAAPASRHNVPSLFSRDARAERASPRSALASRLSGDRHHESWHRVADRRGGLSGRMPEERAGPSPRL